MSNPREETHIYGQYYPVVELEAPQSGIAKQVPDKDTVIFELSGEALVSTQSNTEDIISSAREHTLPQANPWPFYLDEASPSHPPHEGDGASNITAGLEQQLANANPWPFHGVDEEPRERRNDLESEGSLQCRNTILSNPLGYDVPPKVASSPSPDNENNMSHTTGVSAFSQTGNKTTNFKVPGRRDTQFDYVSSPNASTTIPSKCKARGNSTDDMVNEYFRNAESNYQDTILKSNQEDISTFGTDPNPTSNVSGSFVEDSSCVSTYHEEDTQSASHTKDNILFEPTSQNPSDVNMQASPPCSLVQNLASRSGSSSPKTNIDTGPRYLTNIDQTQPYTAAQPARTSPEWQRPIFESTACPEAPPLPPRPLRQHPPLVGLSEGPHSNVSFPPPPKRNNVSATRYPPPLPQRPLSSSKFFGSSSAKRWLDKTNQALEDTLDSVLQGPAVHANRPAYVTHPSTHSPQQTTQSPANQFPHGAPKNVWDQRS